MITTTYIHSGGVGKSVKFLIFVLLLTVLVSFAVSFVQNNHAVNKHGIKAVTVIECYRKDGAIQVWKNIDTNRTAKICMVSNEKIGVIIEEENGDPVTAFVKEKLKNISQVNNYLLNCGYQIEYVSENILEYIFLR